MLWDEHKSLFHCAALFGKALQHGWCSVKKLFCTRVSSICSATLLPLALHGNNIWLPQLILSHRLALPTLFHISLNSSMVYMKMSQTTSRLFGGLKLIYIHFTPTFYTKSIYEISVLNGIDQECGTTEEFLKHLLEHCEGHHQQVGKMVSLPRSRHSSRTRKILSGYNETYSNITGAAGITGKHSSLPACNNNLLLMFICLGYGGSVPLQLA